jgi:Domain of unknown function (DUF3943)
MRFSAGSLTLLVTIAAAPLVAAQTSHEAETRRSAKRNFLRAAGGVLAANTLVWAANRYVKDEPWAKVGVRSWGRNLGAGFTWDSDDYLNNQLGHPYHGSLYFTAARANGYGFWASVPFTATGSLLWEILGETTAPSINDLVTTTLGGVVLGEISHRLSSRVRNHGGAVRGLAAATVNPGGGAQRLLGAGADEPGSPGREGSGPLSSVAIGYLRHWNEGEAGAQAFVQLRVEEASPFDERALRPFDAFALEIEVTTLDPAIVTRARASGLLARGFLRSTGGSQVVAGLFQEYDYTNAGTHETGGQSLSGGLLYRRVLGGGAELRMGGHVRGLVLGAISPDDAARAEGGSDYGPGLGSTAFASLRAGGRDLVRLEYDSQWLWSISGAVATHRTGFARAGLRLPLAGDFGVGADLELSSRDSRYERSATSRRLSRVKIYLSGS